MLIHWIWFSTRPGISDRVRRNLLESYTDPEELYFSSGDSLRKLEGVSEEAAASLADKDLSEADQICAECARKGIHILTWQDAAYPARLKNIPDPPVVLYYKGILPQIDAEPVIAVVGTRSASAYGMGAAKRLGYQIASCGGIVVSGLAKGIDAMAMTGALTAGKSVIGVLGCGADIVYPSFHRSLYEDTQRFGCLLTEFPPGTPPMARNFPRRNRIISGISCGVLVVEAPERSGSLITANLAAEQGRDVFVVPGNIDTPGSVGSNSLLRDGAIAVATGYDILSEYEAIFPGKVHHAGAGSKITAYPDEVRQNAGNTDDSHGKKPGKTRHGKDNSEEKRKNHIDKEDSSSYIDLEKQFPNLSCDEKTLAELLRGGEMLVDDLIDRSGISAGSVLSSLTLLEVKGIVNRLPGRRYTLKSQ